MSKITKITAFLSGSILLSACGGGGTSSPADVSFSGLSYDGTTSTFSGLDLTASMPTGGSASYSGIARGSIMGDYRDGTSALAVNFGAGTTTLSGTIDFTGSATGDGIVSFSIDGTISGNTFSGQGLDSNGSNTASMFGNFYGTDARVGAGNFSTHTASNNQMGGVFIAEKE